MCVPGEGGSSSVTFLLCCRIRVGAQGLWGTPAQREQTRGLGGGGEGGFSSRRVHGTTVKICLGWPIFSFAPIKRKSPRNSIKATLAKALFEA